MLVLAIETSCDDTGAAVVVDGRKILSNVVSSQVPIHQKYGGVVPELASRKHIESIVPIVTEALKIAEVKLKEIDGIAVTHGPGLVGSFSSDSPLPNRSPLRQDSIRRSQPYRRAPLCHLSRRASPEFPFVGLVVSGGHTSLFRIDGFGKLKRLGQTRDDAAGEAFDKVAKLLRLGYPGGPVIDQLSQRGSKGNPVSEAYLIQEFF